MRINVIGLALEPGVGLAVFGGPFVTGASLSVLTLNRPEGAGTVLIVEDGRVLLEIDGVQLWAVPAPERSAPHGMASSPVIFELWEICAP